MSIQVNLVFILFILLSMVCAAPRSPTQEEWEARIQIPEFYPCQGHNTQNQPLPFQDTFNLNSDKVYICAYLDPKSTRLTPGTARFFTVQWEGLDNISKIRYVRAEAGWFYPTLDISANDLPSGIYTVELYAGRTLEAETTFEIVTGE